MKKTIILFIVGLLALPALGSPYFLIDSYTHWDNSLSWIGDGPFTRPMSPLEWDSPDPCSYIQQWGSFLKDGEPYNLGQPTVFYEPELYVYEGLEGGGADPPEEAGLVMAWGDDWMSAGNFSSAFIMEYGVDPDISNCIITVTVIPPQVSGINAISFGIKDINGNIRSWWWQVPMNIPYNLPTTVTIDTSVLGIGATTPMASGFMNNPAFDITQAMSFLADENSAWVGGPTPIPPGGAMPIQIQRIWNYWQDVMVVKKNIKAYKGIHVKYSQPPFVAIEEATPLIYGWDVRSVIPENPDQGVSITMAADDWVCMDERPITDLHWWGSFVGWDQPHLPPQVPDYFQMCIWSDIPGDPANGIPSRPDKLLWQHRCYKWVSNFAGYDLDPRFEYIDIVEYNRQLLGLPQENEACFQFNQLLDEEDYFYQQPMADPEVGNVYWLSIAAVYLDGTEVLHPWGWKTKPYNPEKAPDAAVVITSLDGALPPFAVHDTFVANFFPLLLPNPEMYPQGEWFDLAFELTTNAPKCPGLTADLDGSCKVDLIDFAILASEWLMTSP